MSLRYKFWIENWISNKLVSGLLKRTKVGITKSGREYFLLTVMRQEHLLVNIVNDLAKKVNLNNPLVVPLLNLSHLWWPLVAVCWQCLQLWFRPRGSNALRTRTSRRQTPTPPVNGHVHLRKKKRSSGIKKLCLRERYLFSSPLRRYHYLIFLCYQPETRTPSLTTNFETSSLWALRTLVVVRQMVPVERFLRWAQMRLPQETWWSKRSKQGSMKIYQGLSNTK